MADDKRYMGYWIGHLAEGERNRIHAGGLYPQESEMLSKGGDPWAKFRGPLPPNIPAYIPPESKRPKTETLAGSAETWWGHFYIGHLSQEERNRIKRGEFEPQEIAKLAKGEDAWEHSRYHIPAGLEPPANLLPPLGEWTQSVIEQFIPIDERIRKAVADAAKSALESRPEETRGVSVPEQRRHNLPFDYKEREEEAGTRLPAHGVPSTEKEKRIAALQQFMPQALRDEYDQASEDRKRVLWATNERAFEKFKEREAQRFRDEQERTARVVDLRQRLKEDPSKAHLVPPDDLSLEDLLKWYDEHSQPVNRPYDEKPNPGADSKPPHWSAEEYKRKTAEKRAVGKAEPPTEEPPSSDSTNILFTKLLEAKTEAEIERQKAEREANARATEQAFDNVLRKAGERKEKPQDATDGLRGFFRTALSEIASHRGWYIPAFLVSGFPIGIATVWPVLSHKTIPEWLAEHGLPKLGTLAIAWIAGVALIALVIIVRSCLRVRQDGKQVSSRRSNLEIAQKLTSYMEEGRALLQYEKDSSWWEAEVKTYIEETIGQFEALEWSKPYPMIAYPRNAIHRDRVDRAYTLLQRLGEIVTRLRS